MPKVDNYTDITSKALFRFKRSYFWLAFRSVFVDILSISVLTSTLYTMDLLCKNELWNAQYNDFAILTKLPANRSDELKFMFPHVAKCDIRTFGQFSGNKESREVICNLNQNDSFEKVYILNWLFMSLMLCLIIYEISKGFALKFFNFFRYLCAGMVRFKFLTQCIKITRNVSFECSNFGIF